MEYTTYIEQILEATSPKQQLYGYLSPISKTIQIYIEREGEEREGEGEREKEKEREREIMKYKAVDR